MGPIPSVSCESPPTGEDAGTTAPLDTGAKIKNVDLSGCGARIGEHPTAITITKAATGIAFTFMAFDPFPARICRAVSSRDCAASSQSAHQLSAWCRRVHPALHSDAPTMEIR